MTSPKAKKALERALMTVNLPLNPNQRIPLRKIGILTKSLLIGIKTDLYEQTERMVRILDLEKVLVERVVQELLENSTETKKNRSEPQLNASSKKREAKQTNVPVSIELQARNLQVLSTEDTKKHIVHGNQVQKN
jgi:hypothetical protein